MEKIPKLKTSMQKINRDNTEKLGDLTTEQQALIEQNLKKVRIVAERMLKGFPENIFELNDFISWGTIGLIGSVRSFDPKMGFSLNTFSERRIRGAILDGIRGIDIVSRSHRKFLEKIKQTKTKLQNKLLREPSEDEIAIELGLSIDDFRSEENKYGIINKLYIDDPGSQNISIDQSNLLTLEGLIASDVDIEKETRAREVRSILNEVMKSLSEEEKHIILLLFFEEKSVTEISSLLGLTRIRVSQIKLNILKKLRVKLEEIGISSVY